jgi:cyclic lactone autoinducer peptide
MKKLVRISSSFLSFLSVMTVNSMSFIWFHQPETPKELLKK